VEITASVSAGSFPGRGIDLACDGPIDIAVIAVAEFDVIRIVTSARFLAQGINVDFSKFFFGLITASSNHC
jgi:hypothetical protein